MVTATATPLIFLTPPRHAFRHAAQLPMITRVIEEEAVAGYQRFNSWRERSMRVFLHATA